MDSFEHMRISIKLTPRKIVEEYNLLTLVSDGHILVPCLFVHDFDQTKFTPALMRHIIHPIQLTLVMDDFGVQYLGQEHAQRFIDALEHDYIVSKDWTGGLYCGITLKWDYAHKYMDLSIPG
jgi:hypothetical protein